MQKNWFIWFIALIGIVVIPITVYCNRKMSRNKYMSFAMLGLFTLCLAYTLCWLSSYLLNDWAYSCQATAIMACFMCVALNLYANKAENDLKVMQGLFWCGSILVCVFIIIMLFMYEQWIFISFALLFLIVFSMHIVWDTNRMCGRGECKHGLHSEEFVLSVLMIYADLPTILYDIYKHD